MSENARLFFAVNLSEELKGKIFNLLVEAIPKNGFGKTSIGNLHITLVFLGYAPEEKTREYCESASRLENFGSFEAELNCVGHFKGRILWLGTGKGTQEFNLLAKKLCEEIGVPSEGLHAHVTLARNKGATKEEFDSAMEKLRAKKFFEKIKVRGFDLMRSRLTSKGPIYKKIFSVKFKKS